MEKVEAIEKAAQIVARNTGVRHMQLQINWTPEPHSIDEEVFSASKTYAPREE